MFIMTYCHTYNDVTVGVIESSSEEEEEEEEEDNLLQQSGKLLASSVLHLPKGHIALRRMKDANISKIPPVRRSHDHHMIDHKWGRQ